MQGIVSLLDDTSARAVRALWDELERVWRLREAARSVPLPHLSYHVADGYDIPRASEALRRVAMRTPPLTVRVTGLGAFTEIQPVLYLAVERDATLDALHAAIWRELAETDTARDPWPIYAPATWVPHVTLAMGDLTAEKLTALLAAWATRDVRRTMRIDALSLFGDVAYTPLEQVQLSGTGGVAS